MRRKVCLTNYPGGLTTCFFFSDATFLRPLGLHSSSVPGHRRWAVTSGADICILISASNRSLLIPCYRLFFLFFLVFSFFFRLYFSPPFTESFFNLLPLSPFALLGLRSLGRAEVHLCHRWVIHKAFFDVKSIICKVVQITGKCIHLQRVIDGYCTGL